MFVDAKPTSGIALMRARGNAVGFTYGLVLLGLTVPLAGCGDASSKTAEIRPVRAIVIEEKLLQDDRRAVGEVKPRHESDLAFRVSGKMIARSADIGAVVRKGDVLARLDDQDYRNKLTQAEADFATAQAVLVEAQGAEDRSRQLLAIGYTTRALYDSAVKNLRSAEARLNQSKAAMDMAKDQVNYSELMAEFDGVVTAVGAEAGQVVNSGQMIVRLARSNEKDAVFAIAESAFSSGKPGNERPEISVQLLSNPAVGAEGVVREISPIADPVTRTYLVKVTLNDAPEQMRFGASIVGRLKASGKPVIVLPGSALFDKNGQPAVWVVEPKNGTVALQAVTVARYETDRVIINDGLAQGDVVVTVGVNRLRENQKVRVAGENAL
jgi:RND family efflux transporter MFP subunit